VEPSGESVLALQTVPAVNLSVALMLRRRLKLKDDAVTKAIDSSLRTGDIFDAADPAARKVGTREMGDAIAAGV
jgi:hypothetical protein